jgi:hypothetical protein
LGGLSSKVLLVPKPEEKIDHLAMKLAAYAMFLPYAPVVEPSADHPSLYGFDIKPDVLAIDEGGGIKIWIECGEVTVNKLDKVVRRLPQTRLIVIKAMMRQAKQLRETLDAEVRQAARIQIWTWPEGDFQRWVSALADKTEIFGDAHEKSFNLVVNDTAYDCDLIEV